VVRRLATGFDWSFALALLSLVAVSGSHHLQLSFTITALVLETEKIPRHTKNQDNRSSSGLISLNQGLNDIFKV
jgi:hypothetical protein